MQKSKTRPASKIWASGLALVVTVAMLAGTTFAWFTDTVSSKGNRIQAGTLTAQLFKYTGSGTPATLSGTDWTEITNATPQDFIFSSEFKNLEPGAERTVYLAVKNSGSLAFRYNLDLVVLEDTLSEVLLFGAESSKSGAIVSVSAATPVISVKTGNTIAAAPGGRLLTSEAEYITLTVKMAETAGNTYQNGVFEADVILTATQDNAAAAVVKAYSASDIEGAAAGKTVVLMQDIAENVNLTKPVNLDLNGYTIDGNVNAAFSDAVTMDIGTASSGGNIDGVLTINTPNATINLYAAVTTVNVIAVAPHTLRIFGSVGNLIVQAPGTVLTGTATVSHLILVGGNTVESHGFIDQASTADSADVNDAGEIDLENEEESDFGKVVEISSAADLVSVGNNVDRGITYVDKTIKLVRDIDLGSVANWNPIGETAFNPAIGVTWNGPNVFRGAFDGNGHTIRNLTINRPNEDNVGLFSVANELAPAGKIPFVSFKNVKFENASVKGRYGVGVLIGSVGVSGNWYTIKTHEIPTITGVEVTGSAVTGRKYAGGIAGYSNANIFDSSVSNTSVEAYGVSGDDQSGQNAGGVVGDLYDMFKIDRVTVTGVTVTSATKVGGIAGSSRNAHSITNCTVTGSTLLTKNYGLTLTESLIGIISGRVIAGRVSEYTGNTYSGNTATSFLGGTVPEITVR